MGAMQGGCGEVLVCKIKGTSWGYVRQGFAAIKRGMVRSSRRKAWLRYGVGVLCEQGTLLGYRVGASKTERIQRREGIIPPKFIRAQTA